MMYWITNYTNIYNQTPRIVPLYYYKHICNEVAQTLEFELLKN